MYHVTTVAESGADHYCSDYSVRSINGKFPDAHGKYSESCDKLALISTNSSFSSITAIVSCRCLGRCDVFYFDYLSNLARFFLRHWKVRN
jgi:hypothetical protein